MTSRSALKFVVLLVLLVVAIVMSVRVGAVRYSTREVFDAIASAISGSENPSVSKTAKVIVVDLRLSRAVLAAIVGAALSLSGTAFQGLFRNPLADPFVIGASSGAALGATLAIALGVSVRIAGVPSVPAAAFIGSIASVLIVYGLSTGGTGRPPTVSLLLAGTALSSMLSACVSLIMAIRDSELHRIFFWLLGGFSGRHWGHVASMLPYVIPGIVLLVALARPLDLLSFGEESAQTMGVSVGLLRALTIAGASLTTAAAVAVSGIIGFVGLLAPHAARLLFGPAHRTLMPAAALIGATILVAADLCARTILAPVELPVGVLTSMLGAPFFLFLLRTKRDRLGSMA